MGAGSTRWRIYAVALTLTVAASIWVTIRDSHAENEVTKGAAPARALRTPSVVAGKPGLELPDRDFPDEEFTEEYRDPFGTPPPKAPPPPPIVEVPRHVAKTIPTAPPLPYQYRGIVEASDGSWLVQLSRGDQFLLAGLGDVIDAEYRLESLTDDELTFTYLPLSTLQTLPISASEP
jgi:hypothetical protein